MCLDGAFEILRENMGLNLNPLQDISHDPEATSIWDLGFGISVKHLNIKLVAVLLHF
jgi:hypothetical protein